MFKKSPSWARVVFYWAKVQIKEYMEALDSEQNITLIQTEFDLDELTTKTCQWYKIYGTQVKTGTQEEKEQANFIAKFLDIYENSFFEQ